MYTYEIRDNRCTFTFDERAEELCRSISSMKYLTGFTMTPTYDKLSFHAHDVRRMADFVDRKSNKLAAITYQQAVSMIKHLGGQLFHLERQKRSVLWLDIQHVFVINRQHFFYFGNDDVVPLTTSDAMAFSVPTQLSTRSFAAPEFTEIESLPAHIPRQAPYYSLGAMIAFCLFSDIDPQNISLVQLSPIMDTKLYWFLLRATEPCPKKRSLLFV